MTREEDREIAKAINRMNYLRRREKKLKYSSEYAKRNKDYINYMQRERRKRRNEAKAEIYIPPSIDSIEEKLPYILRKNKVELRREFLSIPILQRPTYDYFLRCKEIELLISYGREHRKDTSTIAVT